MVVVGAGVAGLTGALTAAAGGARVCLVAKDSVSASASFEAQGGVAAAVGPGDSPELHAADTVEAGRGLCRASAVRVLTEEAPARIDELRACGVRFEEALGLEGGHACRRVLHVNGAETGRAITAALARRVGAHPLIELVEGERVVMLAPGAGCTTARREVSAAAVVVATGGFAALWSRTTNPPGSVGEGMSLAFRAGAALADLEFVQFHPTALAGRRLLLSEALRGEGALLVDENGDRIVDELAPRDVVARAIATREHVLLDLRPVDHARFPSLLQRLHEAGHDAAVEPVPVTVAAHYTIGGIATDLDGRTNVPGLYAAGECACTGVHGANRLASNSLLECLVFGRRAALAALHDPRPRPRAASRADPTDTMTRALREELWEQAGLVRDAAGLERLRLSPLLLARLVATCAIERRESRGTHLRVDFPDSDPALDNHHTVLRPGHEPVLEQWN